MKDSTEKEWSLGFDSFDRGKVYCCLDGLNDSNLVADDCAITFDKKGVTLTVMNTSMDILNDLNKRLEKLEDAFKRFGLSADGIGKKMNLSQNYTASKWHFRAKDIVLRFI